MKSLETVVISWALTTLRTTQTTRTRRTDASIATCLDQSSDTAFVPGCAMSASPRRPPWVAAAAV